MKAQTKWRWEHAIYFWLGGLGAAAYVTGIVADFAGWKEIAAIGVWLGLPCVGIGALILLVDLGKPLNAIHAWKRPGTSWIARGVIMLSVFMGLAFISIVLMLFAGNADVLRRIFGVIGIIFAFGVMTYTGFLLGASRPIAFWSTSVLPLVFLASALYTGVLAVMLIASMNPAIAGEQIRALEKATLHLIILQLFALGFYIQSCHRVYESRASAMLVLKGELAPLFWIGVMLVGLVIPLVLLFISITSADPSAGAFLRIMIAIAGIIGSLLLRQTVLAGGVMAPLKVGRFEMSLPHI